MEQRQPSAGAGRQLDRLTETERADTIAAARDGAMPASERPPGAGAAPADRADPAQWRLEGRPPPEPADLATAALWRQPGTRVLAVIHSPRRSPAGLRIVRNYYIYNLRITPHRNPINLLEREDKFAYGRW